MSDPMTNTEVEDVLASIRRLVSDDDRPEKEEKRPERAGRLVLTPALRVTEDHAAGDDDPDADAGDISDDSEDHVQDEGHAAPQADGDNLHEDFEFKHIPIPEPVQNEDVGTPEGEAGGAGDHPIPLETVDLDQDTLLSVRDAFSDGQDWGHDTDSQDSSELSLSAKIAALETLIAGQTQEYEPERPGDGANAGTEAPAIDWTDTDGLPDTDAAAEMIEEQFAETAETDMSPSVDADDFDADEGAPEGENGAVTGAALTADGVDAPTDPADEPSDAEHAFEEPQQASQPADDASITEEMSARPVAPEAEWVMATAHVATEKVERDTDHDHAQVLGGEDDLLDEEALRDLVSAIVREELQGALGERITRNVRKLVRREIHRALAAQDLE
ncbi:MAG: hypothetical protein AAGF36_11930 [Pseudomonadota bacterium]